MATNNQSTGRTLDYTNASGATIASSSVVVIGALIGVALADIAPGETGAASVDGVWHLPKASGALTQGQRIDYDVSANKVAAIGTPASGDLVGCGVVAEGVASGATTVPVKLNVRGAEVTA